MPQLKRGVFGNVSVLNGIPADLFRELFEATGGLDSTAEEILALGDEGDARARALASLFYEQSDQLSDELLGALFMIEDLADENGHRQIAAAAEEQGLPPDLDLGEPTLLVAVRAFLLHPKLFSRAHDLVLIDQAKQFRTFVGREPRAAERPQEEARKTLEADLGRFFLKDGKTGYCEIHPHFVGGSLCFLITHGRPKRAEEHIKEDGGKYRLTRQERRPPGRDLVRYDAEFGLLEVYAADEKVVRRYVGDFGALLFGSPDWFSEAPVLTLEPLARRQEKALELVRGMREVKLVELQIVYEGDPRAELVVKSKGGSDIFKVQRDREFFTWGEGRLARAKLMVKYGEKGRARALVIQPPVRLSYDRRQDDDVTRAFLLKNGFMLPTGRGEPTNG